MTHRTTIESTILSDQFSRLQSEFLTRRKMLEYDEHAAVAQLQCMSLAPCAYDAVPAVKGLPWCRAAAGRLLLTAHEIGAFASEPLWLNMAAQFPQWEEQCGFNYYGQAEHHFQQLIFLRATSNWLSARWPYAVNGNWRLSERFIFFKRHQPMAWGYEPLKHPHIEVCDFIEQELYFGHGHDDSRLAKSRMASPEVQNPPEECCHSRRFLAEVCGDACGFLATLIRAKADNQRQDGRAKENPLPNKKITKGKRVILVMAEHPDWSDAKIANEAGVNRTALYKMSEFKQVKKIRKGERQDMLRGTKHNGIIEAVTEKREEEED